MNILVEHLTDNLVVHNHLIGGGTVGDSECRSRNLGIYLTPCTRHDTGLISDLLTRHSGIEIRHLGVRNKIGDGGHLDVDELHVILVLISIGVELDRLEPLIQHLALLRHIATVVHTRQLQGVGTVAAESLDVGLTVFLRVHHPVLLLGAFSCSYAVEERCAGLLVNRIARVYHMSVHRGAELQLATQLGMVDDMGAVGLEHILNDAHGLRVVALINGL